MSQEWSNEEEKEQFSPVSVLDCPFEDDDQTHSPIFPHKLSCLEGNIISDYVIGIIICTYSYSVMLNNLCDLTFLYANFEIQ